MKTAKTTRKKPAIDTAAAAMQRHADEVVAVLKGLASRNRLLLLCQLVDGERSVGELAQALGLAQSVVSQHLSLLRREGVVAGRRDAQSIRYRIADARVRKLMATMFALFCKD
ncbi:MAG: metalloregulator ArsR/SmtB family transcription factor [Rudaea sp.]|uniref:ArsR/SmtB family transcription factor n=1 Tax=Rudaea sp. TaxID=2136325 RepID=UPI0039E416B8